MALWNYGTTLLKKKYVYIVGGGKKHYIGRNSSIVPPKRDLKRSIRCGSKRCGFFRGGTNFLRVSSTSSKAGRFGAVDIVLMRIDRVLTGRVGLVWGGVGQVQRVYCKPKRARGLQLRLTAWTRSNPFCGLLRGSIWRGWVRCRLGSFWALSARFNALIPRVLGGA